MQAVPTIVLSRLLVLDLGEFETPWHVQTPEFVYSRSIFLRIECIHRQQLCLTSFLFDS